MAELKLEADERVLTGQGMNEDACIVTFPQGMALVQTVDFFTPIVNDPYRFGQIAAANSLSDVYAMGGIPYTAMNIVCFPIKDLPKTMLRDALLGGLDKIKEAGCVMAGGHSVEDKEFKYGLSVSGFVEPDNFSTNSGLEPGQVLILTKPLGTGVLATAVKASWEGSDELENILWKWASHLNKNGGEVIRKHRIKGATDVTGFGLGGHVLEMAMGSKVRVELVVDDIPFIPQAVELAGMGLIPAGSFANKNFCSKQVQVKEGLDQILVDLVFDAQTSGGLVIGVDQDMADEIVRELEDLGEMAIIVGTVEERNEDLGILSLV